MTDWELISAEIKRHLIGQTERRRKFSLLYLMLSLSVWIFIIQKGYDDVETIFASED